MQVEDTCIKLGVSITRENKHYRTPTNPIIATKIPGGSSSGAAIAVAAELVDFALGIDTDGGVRIPAAFWDSVLHMGLFILLL